MIICPNLHLPDVAREFNEIKAATSEKAAYHIWSANNGNGIDKAPNGALSKLFNDLLILTNGNRKEAIRLKAKVYGNSFKEWFGDWINVNNITSNINKADKSLVDVIPYDKPWKSNPSKINKTLRIYLKDHSKGYFELVKDEEYGIYSVHFKTKKEGAKYNGDWETSTKEDRKTLFKELVKLIPEGAQVSTWGELSDEGVIGLNNVGRDMTKVGERVVSSKVTGGEITIPVYQKGKGVSKVVDENGEPLIVYHGSKNVNFNTFNYNYLRKPDNGFFFTSDKEYAKQYGDVRGFFLSIKNPNLTDIPLNIDSVETLLTVNYKIGTDGIKGYDDTNTNENLYNSKGQEYVALRSNQIKSASNISAAYTAQKEQTINDHDGEFEDEFTLKRVDETVEAPVWNQEKDYNFIDDVPLKSLLTQPQYKEYISTIFPNSKVKGLVYHSTSANFDEFDMSKVKRGLGAYFSPYNHWINKFIGKTKIAVVNIQNPLFVSDSSYSVDGLNKKKDSITKEVVKNNHNDGIIGYTNPLYYKGEFEKGYLDIEKDKSKAEIVVFDSNNIHILGTKKDRDLYKQFLKNKKGNTSLFYNLDTEIREALEKKGWTEEMWNSISQEEREQAIRCSLLQT